jgi:UDP-2,3-diacylglucosamine hydrolase
VADRIGLIAGNRRFPVLFCEEARKRGVRVVAVAIRGETSRRLARLVDSIHWLSLGEFERVYDIFHAENITKIVMAGQISPRSLFSRQVRENRAIQELLNSITDRRANSIFGAIANRLAAEGFTLIDSTTFLQPFVPQKGVLTRRSPSESEWSDVRFGMDLARKVADLDIGLAVAVKNKAIVAVEALEGTDNLIRRAGRICKGLVIAKAGRPAQDMRFDIPVIGLHTIKTLIRARVSCIGIEAGKTLIIDMQSAISLADRKGLAIVSV